MALNIHNSKDAVCPGEEEDEDLEWEITPEMVANLKEKYGGMQHPLFMDELPKDFAGNPHLEALNELMYGDDGLQPEERADNFRELGNECFQEASKNPRRYLDALQYYTAGLAQEFNNENLKSILYSNRAHVHLVEGRYVECVDDARRSVKCNPTNVKGFYRGAKASYYLHLFKQCSAFCRKGLQSNPDNAALTQLLRSSEEADGKRRRAREVEDRAHEEKKSTKDQITQILQLRNITWLPGQYDGAVGDSLPRVIDEEETLLSWKALLLYDEFMISEVILDFPENTSLQDQLEVVLPGSRYPEWDTNQQYSWDNVSAFLDVGLAVGSLYEVPLNETLGVLLSSSGQVAGYPVFHIVRKDLAVVEEFKKSFEIVQLELKQ